MATRDSTMRRVDVRDFSAVDPAAFSVPRATSRAASRSRNSAAVGRSSGRNASPSSSSLISSSSTPGSGLTGSRRLASRSGSQVTGPCTSEGGRPDSRA